MRKEADTYSGLTQNGRVSKGKDFNVLSLYPFTAKINFMDEKTKEVLFMKASRKVLGLILVIGMLLSCAAASYATATKAPKFSTTKLKDATWAAEYDETISVSDNTTSKDATINITITDKASADLKGYGLTVTNESDGGLRFYAASLSSDALLKLKSGYKFTVTATNQYEKKAGDGKWQNGTTSKDFTLKLKADAPKFTLEQSR